MNDDGIDSHTPLPLSTLPGRRHQSLLREKAALQRAWKVSATWCRICGVVFVGISASSDNGEGEVKLMNDDYTDFHVPRYCALFPAAAISPSHGRI